MYLNCHTYYSLQYGTLSPKALVEQAATWDIRVLALTDINCCTGVFEFTQLCHKHNIRPIVGIEFRELETETTKSSKLLYIGLARNAAGFKELNTFLSKHTTTKTPLPERAPEFQNVAVIYPLTNVPEQLRPNEYIGIRPADLTKHQLKLQRGELKQAIILQPVTYLHTQGRELHTRLRAIYHNTLLSMLTPDMQGGTDEFMVEPNRIVKRFSNYPEIIWNTQKLIDDCSFEFDFERPKNKELFTTSKNDDRELLHKLAMDGVRYRYGNNNERAVQQVRHELEVIDRLGFCSYFLITWDVINYSIGQGFYHVGRGSGANSIVAFCLKITDVDPIELDLYFERFLNPKRSSPPDFDIDYSWKDRDEVIDYIFKRYGKEHTALLGTVTTFQGRSICRELGKIYGLPKSEIDEMAGNRNFNFNRDDITRQIYAYGKMMHEFPNHRSIHAGGILISEEPITNYTALDMPPKGFQTTQWDMYEAERIRLDKLDILSQRGLGHIKDAVQIVEQNLTERIDIHQIEKFKRDSQVKQQLKSGDSIGCFYIESPAMRGLLNKLRCDDYLTLVAASSIIRPGVASSGMMGEYIKRFHNPDSFTYLHPIMEEQLKETYGVMVYQEDVIKICHHFVGLDLADSDVLRRAMSGKYRSKIEFDKLVQRFFDGCRAKGHSDDLAQEVWRQISSFAGYSFSKAHSASFAVESYQSLFLKTYYPREFYVAVINNFGGFYQTWVYVHSARKAGATIHLPCVNQSEYLTAIYGIDVYLGLIHIKGLEQNLAERILKERYSNGNYKDLYDFIQRTRIGKEQVIILIRTGALRFTGKQKKDLLWEAHMYTSNIKEIPTSTELFESEVKAFTLPVLKHEIIEDGYDEFEMLGFPVTVSQFEMVKLPNTQTVTAKELLQHNGKTVTILGNFVAPKDVKTKYGDRMAFAAFLDINGDFFDTTHFPDSLKKHPLTGRGIYIIRGKAVADFGYPSVEVQAMKRLDWIADPRY